MRFNGGVLVSEGLAYEKAYLYQHKTAEIHHVFIDEDNIKEEVSRFRTSLSALIEDSKAMPFSNAEEKSLIAVHIELLSDPDFKEKIETLISKKRYNAPWAVAEISDGYIATLLESGDEYLSERAADLEDVKRKLVDRLLDKLDNPVLTEPTILVADYFLPSEMLAIDKHYLKGIVLERGGRTSHIAIMARSLGIPAILALKDITQYVENGSDVIVDGVQGNVFIKPNSEEIQFYEEELGLKYKKEKALEKSLNLPAITKDGRKIKILCNIEGLDGIDGAIASGAEGIGLFRTEFLFLQKELFTDEKRKEEIYLEVAASMKDIGSVVVRTMDVGGDKFSQVLGSQEDNPFLGNRSIRYSMEHKELFRNQLISILKASRFGNVELMFPFISGPDELKEVLSFLSEVKAECREKAIPFDEKMKVGTMIEVPSAAITSDIIADMVDFMSIGTNDLVQYTIAVDRGNSKVARLYDPLHPAVLRLIRLVIDNARKKNKPLSICGEMAGSVEYLPVLVGLGIEALSMVAPSILEVKDRIRQLDYGECKKLVDRLLTLQEQSMIKEELEEFNGKT